MNAASVHVRYTSLHVSVQTRTVAVLGEMCRETLQKISSMCTNADGPGLDVQGLF